MADDIGSRQDDALESDEEVDESAYRPTRDAILFAINISPSMLTPPPPSESKKADTDSPAIAALECAYQLMEQRIISNPRDMMGILLYGTKKSQFFAEESGDISYPHCYLLQDLNVPAAEDVRRLRDIVTDDEVAADLLQPHEEPVSMSNVLFCANQIFTTRAPNFSSRRLFVVTDNDNPHRDNKTLRQAAAVRARDLYDLGIMIELFPIQRPEQKFDRTVFYDDIVYRSSPQDPEANSMLEPQIPASTSSSDGISLMSSLLSSVISKSVPKRAMFTNMPLELGPGLTISVNGYLIFKRQTPQRSCYIWQGGEKPQLVKGKTILKADDTGKEDQVEETQKPEIQRADIQRAYTFGGEQVTFLDEEQKQLRFFGKPVVRVLGFKPLDDLPFWASIKPATFIYPSEAGFVGSTRVFSALWQTLLKKERWALTWFIARLNAKPRLAAMIAANAKLDEHGNPTVPGGLWIVPLPFVDDIRPNPPAPHIPAPTSLVEKMSVIVEQLLLPGGEYNPFRYPNPALQYHYKIIQAIALDEDLPEKPVDKTIPKYKQIDKRAGPYMHEWADELRRVQKEQGLDRHEQTATLTKRRAPATKDMGNDHEEQRSRTKKVRREDQSTGSTANIKSEQGAGSDVGEAEEEIREAWEAGTLSKCKVTTLKDFLSAHGAYTSREKKAQMLEKAERILSGK